MQVSDDCAICRGGNYASETRGAVATMPAFFTRNMRLATCSKRRLQLPYMSTKPCWQRATSAHNISQNCPKRPWTYCIAIECSNRGEDWKTLATTLGVKYKTAYTWIRSGSTEAAKRGGGKPRALTQHLVNEILIWLEEDCSITLKKIQEKFLVEHRVIVLTTTIANYIEGQIYTLKQVHWQPCAMNSEANKELRRQFVISLNNYNYTRRKTDHVDRRDQL